MKQASKRVLNRIALVMLLVGGMYSGISMAAIDQTDTTNQCTVKPNWFENGRVVRPNDATFPNDPQNQNDPSNCNFHQWSWHMFLWLMDGDNNKPRFLDFATPQSLVGLKQRGILPRTSKKQHGSSLDEYLQAGTDGILVDQNNRAVYYSQYVNQTYADFVQGRLGGKDLTNPDNVLAMVPTTEFPIHDEKGALELKASWKIVAPDDNVEGLFTVEKEIAKFVNTPSGVKIDPTQVEQQTLALVGFHIGGIVANHPEMIWATFEFNKNAPNVPDGMKLEDVVSDQDYLFYKKGTQLGNCNKNAGVNGLTMEEQTQKFSPVTQVCRRYAFGNQTGQKQSNTDNIKSLNASVWANLPKQLGYLSNYFQVGAIWINNTAGTNDPLKSPLKPGLTFATDEILTGSLRLSNSTIETYTQSATAMNNCFRCHNTEQAFAPKPDLTPLPATNLNISHAFQNIFFWSQEKDKTAAMAYLTQGAK